METDFRCDCPISTAVDIVGDKWILVIIKQMLVEHKQTFKEFTESDEAISTNILSAKLKLLEENGLIKKNTHPTNKKTNLYHLTDLGLSLDSIIAELALWSDQRLRKFHPSMNESEALQLLRDDKQAFCDMLTDGYREKVLNFEL